MSRHYRKENNCLNCGSITTGRFCSECGQENLEPKESFSHLLGHFFGHYFHFDSKFWSSVKPLLIKPGFLTNEYSAGRRVSYINPLNLYFFISVVYFLVSASLPEKTDRTGRMIRPDGKIDTVKLSETGSIIMNETDTTDNDSSTLTIFNGDTIQTNKYKTAEEYTKAQASLPKEKRDGFLASVITKRQLQFRENPKDTAKEMRKNFAKNLPKFMFVMLPLFALLIHFFYRKSKKYFVENVIFSIHFHAFVFFILLFAAVINAIIPLDFFYLLVIPIFIFYLYKALRKVFHQSRIKTILKTILVICFYGILLAIGQFINVLIVFLLM